MTIEVKLIHMHAIKLYRGQSKYICMIPYDIHSMNVVSGIFYVIPENMRLAPSVILDLKISKCVVLIIYKISQIWVE
jgi:hypothetical protein